MIIGTVRETKTEEYRVALTPDGVADIVNAGHDVLVDLSQVPYMDSSGVASLVEAYQLSRTGGTRMALVAVTPQVLRVLELARLDRVFPIFETLAAASAAGSADDGA